MYMYIHHPYLFVESVVSHQLYVLYTIVVGDGDIFPILFQLDVGRNSEWFVNDGEVEVQVSHVSFVILNRQQVPEIKRVATPSITGDCLTRA